MPNKDLEVAGASRTPDLDRETSQGQPQLPAVALERLQKLVSEEERSDGGAGPQLESGDREAIQALLAQTKEAARTQKRLQDERDAAQWRAHKEKTQYQSEFNLLQRQVARQAGGSVIANKGTLPSRSSQYGLSGNPSVRGTAGGRLSVSQNLSVSQGGARSKVRANNLTSFYQPESYGAGETGLARGVFDTQGLGILGEYSRNGISFSPVTDEYQEEREDQDRDQDREVEQEMEEPTPTWTALERKMLQDCKPRKFGRHAHRAGEWEEFAISLRSYLDAYGARNNQAKVMCLKLFLEGGALQHVNNLLRREFNMPFEDIMHHLEQHYSRPRDVVTARRSLNFLVRKRQETYPDFVGRIYAVLEDGYADLSLAARTSVGADALLRNIPEEWQEKVLEQAAEHDLDEYLQVVLRLEQQQERKRTTKWQEDQYDRSKNVREAGRDRRQEGQREERSGSFSGYQTKSYPPPRRRADSYRDFGDRQPQQPFQQRHGRRHDSRSNRSNHEFRQQSPRRDDRVDDRRDNRRDRESSTRGGAQNLGPSGRQVDQQRPGQSSREREGQQQAPPQRRDAAKADVEPPTQASVKCYYCKEKGHISRFCPDNPESVNYGKKPQPKAPVRRIQKVEPGLEFGDFHDIFKVNTVMHATLSHAHPVAVAPIVKYPVEIEGLKLNAVIDTGSVVSIIPAVVINKLGRLKGAEWLRANKAPFESKLHSFDGRVLKNMNFTLTVTLSIDGTAKSVPLVVDVSDESTLNSEILLGVPTLTTFNFRVESPGGVPLFSGFDEGTAKEQLVQNGKVEELNFVRWAGLLTDKTIPSMHTRSVLTEAIFPLESDVQKAQEVLFLPSVELEKEGLAAETCILKLEDDGKARVPIFNMANWPTRLCSESHKLGEFVPLNSGEWEIVPLSECLLSELGEASVNRVVEPRELTEERKAELIELLHLEQWNIPEQQRQLVVEELLQQHEMFATTMEELGEAEGLPMEIDTGDAPPHRDRCRKVPFVDMAELGKQVREMLASGIIEQSQSPWASAIVIVRKKGTGEMRVCVDYTKLNSVTKKNAYPLPNCTTLLDSAGSVGAKYFSTLDLRSGYHQFLLSDDAKEKSAFICPYGLFQYKRMPFGLTNAPATFQRFMDCILAGIELKFGPGKVNTYIDDILIATPTFHEHVEIILEILVRLRKAGLKLHPKKCKFFRKQVEFLGYVLSAEGLHPDESKLVAVRQFPKPTTVTKLKSFLGLCSYYRRFIKNFSQVALPLNMLLRGNVKALRWNDDAQRAFDMLKTMLTTAPILKFPELNKEFVIHTDGSGLGLGAVLMQREEKSKDLRPVAFTSRSLKGAEVRYWSTDLEMMCVVYALKAFRPYIHRRQVTIYTDNQNTIDLVRKEEDLISSRQQRWKLFILNSGAKLIHLKGVMNKVADALSRNPVPDDTTRVLTGMIFALMSDRKKVAATPNIPVFQVEWMKRIQEAQKTDPLCRKVYDFKQFNILPDDPVLIRWLVAMDGRFQVVGDVVFYTEPTCDDALAYKIFVPEQEREALLWEVHVSPLGGHLGREKVLHKLKSKYYWPQMSTKIESYLNSCIVCASRSGQGRRTSVPLKSLATPEFPFQVQGMDILKLNQTTKGNKYALVMTDLFSGFTLAVPVPDVEATTIVQAWLEAVLPFGPPEHVLTDRGAQFTGQLMKSVCDVLQVKQLFTTTFHPQTNGQTEKANRTLCDMLSKVSDKKARDWDDMLKFVLFAYNSSVHARTGQVPFVTVFGRQPNFLFGTVMAYPTQYYNIDLDDFQNQFPKMMKDAWELVREKSDKAKERAKSQYDKHVPQEHGFAVDDLVMIRDPAQKKHKLGWEFIGPGKIVAISDTNAEVSLQYKNKQVVKKVHIDKLSRAKPELAEMAEPQQALQNEWSFDAQHPSFYVEISQSELEQRISQQIVGNINRIYTVVHASGGHQHYRYVEDQYQLTDYNFQIQLNAYMQRVHPEVFPPGGKIPAPIERFARGRGRGRRLTPVSAPGQQSAFQPMAPADAPTTTRFESSLPPPLILMPSQLAGTSTLPVYSVPPPTPREKHWTAPSQAPPPKQPAPEPSTRQTTAPVSVPGPVFSSSAATPTSASTTASSSPSQTDWSQHRARPKDPFRYPSVPGGARQPRMPSSSSLPSMQPFRPAAPSRSPSLARQGINITPLLPPPSDQEVRALGTAKLKEWINHFTRQAVAEGELRNTPDLEREARAKREVLPERFEFQKQSWYHDLPFPIKVQLFHTPNMKHDLYFECLDEGIGLRQGVSCERFMVSSLLHSGHIPMLQTQYMIVNSKYTLTTALEVLCQTPHDSRLIKYFGYDTEMYAPRVPAQIKRQMKWAARDQTLKTEHETAMARWKKNGSKGSPPVRRYGIPADQIELTLEEQLRWRDRQGTPKFGYLDLDQEEKELYGIKPAVQDHETRSSYISLMQITSFFHYATFIFVMKDLCTEVDNNYGGRMSVMPLELQAFLRDHSHRFVIIDYRSEEKALKTTFGIDTTPTPDQQDRQVHFVDIVHVSNGLKVSKGGQMAGVKHLLTWCFSGDSLGAVPVLAWIEGMKAPTTGHQRYPDYSRQFVETLPGILWDYAAFDAEACVYILGALLCTNHPEKFARWRSEDPYKNCLELEPLRELFFQLYSRPACTYGPMKMDLPAMQASGRFAKITKEYAKYTESKRKQLPESQRRVYTLWPHGFEELFQDLVEFAGTLKNNKSIDPKMKRELIRNSIHRVMLRWRLIRDPPQASGEPGALLQVSEKTKAYRDRRQYSQRLQRGAAASGQFADDDPRGNPRHQAGAGSLRSGSMRSMSWESEASRDAYTLDTSSSSSVGRGKGRGVRADSSREFPKKQSGPGRRLQGLLNVLRLGGSAGHHTEKASATQGTSDGRQGSVASGGSFESATVVGHHGRSLAEVWRSGLSSSAESMELEYHEECDESKPPVGRGGRM